MTINDAPVAGDLYEHPVARELFELLPLELVFSDFNQVEKVAPLGHSLTLRGVPHSDAPGPGEIGYYTPSRVWSCTTTAPESGPGWW